MCHFSVLTKFGFYLRSITKQTHAKLESIYQVETKLLAPRETSLWLSDVFACLFLYTDTFALLQRLISARLVPWVSCRQNLDSLSRSLITWHTVLIIQHGMIIKKTDQERYSESSRKVVRWPIWRLSNLISVLNLRLLVTGSACSYFSLS